MNAFMDTSGLTSLPSGRGRALAGALSYVARRVLRFPQTPLARAAERSFTICQASELPAVTPFYWDDHLPRIRGSATYGAEQVIREDLNRKIFQFRPVVGHWLRDAMLLDGSLYAGGYRHELRHANQRRRIGFNPSGAAAEIERAAMVSTCAGTTWWGHWVEDEVPMQMLAEKFAAPVAFNRPEYRDECAYRQVFGIAEPKRLDVAHFHELLLLEDFAQNPNKTKRYRALRHRLARLPAGHERVYLRRGSTGVRRSLVNEAEVMQRLEGLGFKTVDVATNSAQDIIKSCRGAEVVVSIEGSHLAPLLYLMGDFATLVILNPPHQVHTTVADIGVFCGLTSGMFVCEPEGDTRTDFRADQDELARFIEDAVTFGKRNAPRMEGFLESVMRLDTSGTLLGENVSPQPIDISFEAA